MPSPEQPPVQNEDLAPESPRPERETPRAALPPTPEAEAVKSALHALSSQVAGDKPITGRDIDGVKKALEALYARKLELLVESAYEQERHLHKEAGFLETLSDGTEGLTDLYGKEHAFPTKAEALSRLETKRELIEKKLAQYERPRLLIVPFGKSLPDFAHVWKQTLATHKDTLHNEDGSKETVNTTMTGKKYENAESPAWVWKQYETAEKSGDLVYDPHSLDEHHGGKTKKQKLAELGGYSVILIDDMTDLPAEGVAKTKKGRPTPEANHSPGDYLSMLQTNPHYAGEQGCYPEETLYLYIRNLREKGGLITDNWQKNGKSSYSLGAYFKGSARAPYSGWRSDDSRGSLGGDDVSGRRSGDSVRFRVGV